MRLLAPNGALGLPYGRSFLASFSDVVVLTVMLRLVGGIRLARITDVVGLRRPAARSIVSLATILSVATIVCALTAPQSASLRFADLAWLGIGGPVFEEINYRGLAIGGLMVFAAKKSLAIDRRSLRHEHAMGDFRNGRQRNRRVVRQCRSVGADHRNCRQHLVVDAR